MLSVITTVFFHLSFVRAEFFLYSQQSERVITRNELDIHFWLLLDLPFSLFSLLLLLPNQYTGLTGVTATDSGVSVYSQGSPGHTVFSDI